MFSITSRKPVGNWIDSSIRPEQTPQLRAKYLEDDEYLENMREREGIFKFIIQNFVFDPNDIFSYGNFPILLLGYDSTPLATELSQWKYPITLLVNNYGEKKDATNIASRHNGTMKIQIFPFYKKVPGNRIVVWVDEKNNLSPGRKVEYIKYLQDRCNVLIVSTPSVSIRERIIREVKNVNVVSKFGGTPLLIIYH